jgi:hypothetical protein
MADDYAYTESGGIYTGQDRGDEAGDLVFRMIPIVQAGQRRHDFTETDALMLMGLWEQVGEILRSPDYHRLISWAWLSTRSTGEGPNSKKPSQVLLEALQRLRGATDGINTMQRVMAFNAAEAAMLAFMSAFRAKLTPSAKQTFDRRLKGNMTLRSLSPALQHL